MSSSNVTQVLGIYHFFSKFLSGLVLLIGLVFFLPADRANTLLTSTTVLFAATLVSTVAGQLLHALSVGLESVLPDRFVSNHRTLFGELVTGDRTIDASEDGVDEQETDNVAVADVFASVCHSRYGIDLSTAEDFGTLYSLVRSRIEIDNRGRSIQFQALHSFSRSTAVALLILALPLAVIVILGRTFTTTVGFKPVVLALTPIQQVIMIATMIAVAGLFGFGHRFYKEKFVEYTVTDFCNLEISDHPNRWTDE